MENRKRVWLVYLAGITLGTFGLASFASQPVKAATQTSVAKETSAASELPEQTDNQFAPVNTDQPISQAFKDQNLASIVAQSLDSLQEGTVTVDSNLKEAVEGAKASEDSGVIGQPDAILLIDTPITDWTGIDAVAGLFGLIEITKQSDFDQKVGPLIGLLGNPNWDLDVELNKDGIGNGGFNDLMALSKNGTVRYGRLDVSDNEITDFSKINDLLPAQQANTVTGLREKGAAKASALKVKNGSFVIHGGVPGAQFLPDSYNVNQTAKNGEFRLETPDSTEDSTIDDMPTVTRQYSVGNQMVSLDNIYGFNQVDFNDHSWGYIHPMGFIPKITQMPIDSNINEADINMDKFNDVVINNIPDDVNSLSIRTFWVGTDAEADRAPLTNLVTIPLERDSSQSSSSGTTASTSSQSSSAESSSQNQNSSSSQNPSSARKGQAVYALKKIGLYSKPTFTQHARRFIYRRQSRIKRPQFVVTGYAQSDQGRLRYKVRDVNHGSATFGRQGYITAKSAYVVKTYYQKAPKKVQVISPRGVNTYKQGSLTRQTKHYRKGQILRIKKLVKHNLTTRLVLSNGDYVTANKTMVKAVNK